jgi:tetratricopeptide (TPR) repeat protein
MKIHAQAPLLGTGAGAYGTLRLRYRLDGRSVRHAHGYVVQTLADLGWIGLGLSLFAAGAWLTSMVRTVGLRRRDLALHWDAERVGLATLAAVALVFGLHSTVDWTWFVPGNVLPALLCAGWVASRATLKERIDGILEPKTTAPFSRVGAAAGALVLLIAVLASWSALQPVRASHAQDAAFARLEIGALPQAASIAEIAHKRNPLSVDPLFALAAIEQVRGRNPQAQKALEQAVNLEPANPETWRRLGYFRLNGLKDRPGALKAFQAAYFLNPRSALSAGELVTVARMNSAG